MLSGHVKDDHLPSPEDPVTRAAAAQYLCGCLPGHRSRFEAIRDEAVYAALATGVPVQHLSAELRVGAGGLWHMAQQHVLRRPD